MSTALAICERRTGWTSARHAKAQKAMRASIAREFELTRARSGRISSDLAERVGFEPTRPLRAHQFSRLAPSSTRPSLRRSVSHAPSPPPASNASVGLRWPSTARSEGAGSHHGYVQRLLLETRPHRFRLSGEITSTYGPRPGGGDAQVSSEIDERPSSMPVRRSSKVDTMMRSTP